MAKGKHRVRIISGDLKGRLLDYPKQGPFRPTMQRTRSSVFETLGAAIEDSVFVDLFAAAGANGIEALSRGARLVCFVERHRAALDCLRQNLDRCNIATERYRILAGNVETVIAKELFGDLRPDVIYADPPYADADFGVLLELLGKIVYPDSAVIVIEHATGMLVDVPSGFLLAKTKPFGGTSVSFLNLVR